MAALQGTRTPASTHASRSTIHTEQDIGKLLGMMSEPLAVPMPARRGFLRGLASLPLIGGGVALFGQPTAVAEPVTVDLLATYADWLHFERRVLMSELTGHQPREAGKLALFVGTRSDDFHFPRGMTYQQAPQPSTRAALVLSTVGLNWREASR